MAEGRDKLSPVIKTIAMVVLALFLVAFPLATVIDGLSRGSYPELGVAVIEVGIIVPIWLWLRSYRRRPSRDDAWSAAEYDVTPEDEPDPSLDEPAPSSRSGHPGQPH